MAGNTQEIDELFGKGQGGGQPQPRTALVVILLVSGVLATVGGMMCTAAPGGILVLLSWVIIEKEVDRVESGYLPMEDKPQLLRIQRMVQAGLVLVIFLFLLQTVLFCYGFYEWWWGTLLRWAFTGEAPI